MDFEICMFFKYFLVQIFAPRKTLGGVFFEVPSLVILKIAFFFHIFFGTPKKWKKNEDLEGSTILKFHFWMQKKWKKMKINQNLEGRTIFKFHFFEFSRFWSSRKKMKIFKILWKKFWWLQKSWKIKKMKLLKQAYLRDSDLFSFFFHFFASKNEILK